MPIRRTYTPGVAAPCVEIHRDPDLIYKYSAKAHLIGVITKQNGGSQSRQYRGSSRQARYPRAKRCCSNASPNRFAWSSTAPELPHSRELRTCIDLGARSENVTMCDIDGVIYKGRTDRIDRLNGRFATDTSKRTVLEALEGTDVFFGLSAGNCATPEMLLG